MSDSWDEFNNYYKNNPPDAILDDLGIHHAVEIPLPAKYEKAPCQCSIIHKWEIPHTFELDALDLLENAKELGISPKIVKRCKTCKEVLILKKYEEEK